MSAGVRTSLLPPLSPSVQGRTEVRVIEPLPTCVAGLLHGWIVRWPMTHLCRNPQAVGRGSARLLRKGRGMSGQPLLAVLGMILTMQRYEAVVGWPRFSLPAGENLPHYFMMSVFSAVGNTPSDCHAPHGYLLGHRKINSRTARSKGSKPKGKS